MTDVNNISEVPFVAAEAHTADTFCKNTTTINNSENLPKLISSMLTVGLEVNVGKTKYMLLSQDKK
jgi:hypothetical protein